MMRRILSTSLLLGALVATGLAVPDYALAQEPCDYCKDVSGNGTKYKCEGGDRIKCSGVTPMGISCTTCPHQECVGPDCAATLPSRIAPDGSFPQAGDIAELRALQGWEPGERDEARVLRSTCSGAITGRWYEEAAAARLRKVSTVIEL
jgi:hypothetical protein